MSGVVGFNQLECIDGERIALEGCTSLEIAPGEALLIVTPGGGGYGTK